MKQKHKTIKTTVEFYYKQIKEAEEALEELRERCDHPETELCTYTTGPGRYYDNTEICSICGHVVSWAENPQIEVWTKTGRVDNNTPIVEWPAGYYMPIDNSDKPKIGENIVDDFKPGTTESWDDGGCATGLGGDQYDENN